MKPVKIAFDVDNTLIDQQDKPIFLNIQLLILLSKCKNVKITVWSGGGEDYARHWVQRLGIDRYVAKVQAKDPLLKPDIAFDDQHEFDMGGVAVIVRQNHLWKSVLSSHIGQLSLN